MQKKLYRSMTDKKVAGVCGGFAEFLSIDATVIRLAFALFVLFGGSGILAYILCALIIPVDPNTAYQAPFDNQNPYGGNGPQNYS